MQPYMANQEQLEFTVFPKKAHMIFMPIKNNKSQFIQLSSNTLCEKNWSRNALKYKLLIKNWIIYQDKTHCMSWNKQKNTLVPERAAAGLVAENFLYTFKKVCHQENRKKYNNACKRNEK